MYQEASEEKVTFLYTPSFQLQIKGNPSLQKKVFLSCNALKVKSHEIMPYCWA
jgi:hypothetical protein